jgi:hypothetical protein
MSKRSQLLYLPPKINTYAGTDMNSTTITHERLPSVIKTWVASEGKNKQDVKGKAGMMECKCQGGTEN